MTANNAANRPSASTSRVRYLLRGEPVDVLVRWNGKGPRNVLIRYQDGREVVRPFRGLRVPRDA